MENVKVQDLELGSRGDSYNYFHNHFLWLYGKTEVGKSYRANLIREVIELFIKDYKKFNPLGSIFCQLEAF